jgi:hypothetical protein
VRLVDRLYTAETVSQGDTAAWYWYGIRKANGHLLEYACGGGVSLARVIASLVLVVRACIRIDDKLRVDGVRMQLSIRKFNTISLSFSPFPLL